MMTPSAPVLAPITPARTPRIQTLDIAYTPDSDDAFNFLGWEHGHVTLAGFTPRFHRNHIAELN
ncbi:MAG: hypothetical protein NTV94_04395, partial [Planctomycetota bacterium]|nr:hypothetical protein [Planctomycetota bacterium]